MTSGSQPRIVQGRERPVFPKRAVVTAGMPYGNKDLHFGHIGGVFVHADTMARFLRDRLGADHVIFVSGTDCYGSAIVEEHRGRIERGEFEGSVEDFARQNWERQRATLDTYGIAPDAFAASALEPWVGIHRELGAHVMRTLHAAGHLQQRSTLQFYDPEAETFLNGRQVVGRCPIAGCKSEKAYAEECSLGHQFEPSELIAPRSTLSDQRPEMREVSNWYLPLEPFLAVLKPWFEQLLADGSWRDFSVRNLLEYFEPPTIHVTKDQAEKLSEVQDELPQHEVAEGKSKSQRLVFGSLEELDQAKKKLAEHGIRYRTGKSLVPFRLTGNLDWGLPAPELEGTGGLTFWVWPESLWAPISFTAAVLKERGSNPDDWPQWWSTKDAGVYQYIGEDNIFYYGLAQAALFIGMQGPDCSPDAPEGEVQLTQVVTNRHLLFLDKKASSSGKVKPPLARELVDHYTAEQLRIHFLSMALGSRNVSFRPKPFDPKANERSPDPVLKEGNVLSNAFNRAARSCFYTCQKFYERRIPQGQVRADFLELSENLILDWEAAMARQEFHVGIEHVAAYIREINGRWSRDNPYKDECDPDVRAQAVVDAFHGVRVAAALLHPVAPEGTERIREHLRMGEELWSWERIFEPLAAFADLATHELAEVPPRFDFFEKHPSQV
jgi:methionyl-tRNA synthetase